MDDPPVRQKAMWLNGYRLFKKSLNKGKHPVEDAGWM
jgi:hypothetical protein